MIHNLLIHSRYIITHPVALKSTRQCETNSDWEWGLGEECQTSVLSTEGTVDRTWSHLSIQKTFHLLQKIAKTLEAKREWSQATNHSFNSAGSNVSLTRSD